MFEQRGRILNDSTIVIFSDYVYNTGDSLLNTECLLKFYPTSIKPDSTNIWFVNKNIFNQSVRHVRASGDFFSCLWLTGLKNFHRGAASVEEAMKADLVLGRSFFEKNLIILSTMGNNAPFIGLLGTVLGVIKAFHDLGVAGSSGVSVVMSGISAALIATAFGILLAIPAVIANNVFQTRLKRSVVNAQSLIHLMQVYLRSEEKPAKAAHKHEKVVA